MIKIVAVAPKDGWGIIKTKNKILILKPPYTKHRTATEDDVGRAIGLHGFLACDIALNSMEEVIAYFNGVHTQALRERGITIATRSELAELLKYAPHNTLVRFLNRALNELIPQGKYDVAKAIARDIRNLGLVQTNKTVSPAIMRKALQILSECKTAKQDAKRSIIERTNHGEKKLN